MPGGGVRIRALRAGDAAPVLALAGAELDRSRYGRGPRAALDGALAAPDAEYRGLVAEQAARIVGVVVYGSTAGAEGAGRLYLVATESATRKRGIATRLIEAAAQALAGAGTRFVIAEIPDDAALAATRSLLARCSFAAEATVPDYFRDGVALTILRRELATTTPRPPT